MKHNVALLDCTLRDGGYVNDWEFGNSNLISIYERIAEAGVDIIEIGFLDERRPFDINKSIMPDTASAGKIWGCAKKKPPMVVGMIDYGTCPIENIQPCEESYLDGIRIIFKKHIMKEAMEFCAQVKALGYKVFSQLVSITSYSDEELLELVELVNEVKPYAVSMVDTYGLFHPNDLLHYYEILDKNVDEDIQIGFHAHNNFQLAYADVLAFLEKERRHDIVVDATLYGMGKSAGNAPIELVAMQMNQNYGKHYKINHLLEAIEESVMSFYKESPWGYKMFFYLAASNECHPNYVSYFQKKPNLSVSTLNEMLSRIDEGDKKLLYDEALAANIYNNYLSSEGNDECAYQKLYDELKGRELLLVGPGKNIKLQFDKVQKYIEDRNPIVISINYIPDSIPVDYVFVTKSQRYQMMISDLHKPENGNVKFIATSNVQSINKEFEFILNREPLLEKKEDIMDNSFLMLLTALENAGVIKIAFAGFDGYSDSEDNYFDTKMEYSFVKNVAGYLNAHTRSRLELFEKKQTIEFITYSHYADQEDWRSARF